MHAHPAAKPATLWCARRSEAVRNLPVTHHAGCDQCRYNMRWRKCVSAPSAPAQCASQSNALLNRTYIAANTSAHLGNPSHLTQRSRMLNAQRRNTQWGAEVSAQCVQCRHCGTSRSFEVLMPDGIQISTRSRMGCICFGANAAVISSWLPLASLHCCLHTYHSKCE